VQERRSKEDERAERPVPDQEREADLEGDRARGADARGELPEPVSGARDRAEVEER
jgi:hypothetical protein